MAWALGKRLVTVCSTKALQQGLFCRGGWPGNTEYCSVTPLSTHLPVYVSF